MSKKSPQNEPDIQTYKEAVWDFLLEHSDVTERGSFFVKFHTSGRGDFEKRIRARYKYNYHRDDSRTGFDIRQKERDAEARKQAHHDAKTVKKRRHVLGRDERIKAMAELRRQREEQERLARMPTVLRVIHRLWMQPLAQKWYNIHTLWQKQRAQNRNRSNASTVTFQPKTKED